MNMWIADEKKSVRQMLEELKIHCEFTVDNIDRLNLPYNSKVTLEEVTRIHAEIERRYKLLGEV